MLTTAWGAAVAAWAAEGRTCSTERWRATGRGAAAGRAAAAAAAVAATVARARATGGMAAPAAAAAREEEAAARMHSTTTQDRPTYHCGWAQAGLFRRARVWAARGADSARQRTSRGPLPRSRMTRRKVERRAAAATRTAAAVSLLRPHQMPPTLLSLPRLPLRVPVGVEAEAEDCRLLAAHQPLRAACATLPHPQSRRRPQSCCRTPLYAASALEWARLRLGMVGEETQCTRSVHLAPPHL